MTPALNRDKQLYVCGENYCVGSVLKLLFGYSVSYSGSQWAIIMWYHVLLC